MPIPYAVKSSRWVESKHLDSFLQILEEYAGSVSPETRFCPNVSKTYVTVEFMDVEDFNYFDRICYMLFDTHSQEYRKTRLSWFQRVLKRLKNLI